MRTFFATLLLVLISGSAWAQEPQDTYRLRPGWYEVGDYPRAERANHSTARHRSHGKLAETVGSRPAGCPSRAWCGCYLGKLLGLTQRSLWLARNWAHVGVPAGGPAPGVIVVWSHHVGKVTAVDGHRIKVLSGNDGHAVRERWRTTAGVIAWRRV